MNDEKDRIMGVEGLAKYLNLSKSTVYKLAQEGALPGQKVGKHWRFRQETVNNWMDEERPQKESAAQEPEKTAESETKSQDTIEPPPGGPPLGGVFSSEQIDRLRGRWIETSDQLLSIAATQSGNEGIRRLLEIDEEAFAEALRQLEKMRGISMGIESYSTAPGGKLGLSIEGNHGIANKEEPEQE